MYEQPIRSSDRNPQAFRTAPEPAQQPRQKTPQPNKIYSPAPTKQFEKPNENNSPQPEKTIPNNSGNNSPPELIEPSERPPQASVPAFKKVGKVGRQRKYDLLGIDDIEPIKEVVLFRHQMGKHWPGLSKDMENYYERMYFTRPKKGSKDEKHKRCWERRERWIKPATSTPEST